MTYIIFTNQQLDETEFAKIQFAYGSSEPSHQNGPTEIYNMLREFAKVVAANTSYSTTEEELFGKIALCIHPFQYAYYTSNLPQLEHSLVLHVKIPKSVKVECEFSSPHCFIRTKYGRILSIMPDVYMQDSYSDVIVFKWHSPDKGWSDYTCNSENLAAKEYEIFQTNFTTWSVNYTESFHDPPQCEIINLDGRHGAYLFMETPSHGPGDQTPIFRMKDPSTGRWRPGTSDEEKELLAGSKLPPTAPLRTLSDLRKFIGFVLSDVFHEYQNCNIRYITKAELTAWGFP